MTYYLGKREIDWEEVSQEAFEHLISLVDGDMPRVGIVFPTMPQVLNVRYYEPQFLEKLVEKFEVREPYEVAPELVFVRHNEEKFGFSLPSKHYGYVEQGANRSIVFAGSFGMFKSTISGFASLQVADAGYLPAHSSVLSIGEKGVLLVGGSGAGKTTTLIKLVSRALRKKETVRVLTDDWSVLDWQDGCLYAQAFDPSISLRQKDLDFNTDALLHNRESLVEQIAQKGKISLSPNELFGTDIGARKIRIDTIVILKPVVGEAEVQKIDQLEFATAAVETAYHYPYVQETQKELHRQAWAQIYGRVPTASFFTRGFGENPQSLEALWRVFHE